MQVTQHYLEQYMSISRILKDLILNEHVCSIKVGLFKVIFPMALSLVIPEVLCLSLLSPAHGLVGSKGG